jgi:hypothetical protein
MKYKVISADMVKNLITFLDEVQFDALSSNTPEDMQRINFCNWAIEELMNSYDAYLRKDDMKGSDKKSKKPQSKSRDTYVEETFMDWNLPEMTDEEYEKLVDQFDAFLRGWEKDYYKKNPKDKPKKKRERFHKPHIEDVAEYMSLEEIKEFLLDDPELTDNERFELYYEEHDRVQREKQRKKEEKNSVSYDKMLKDLGISPSTNNDKGDNNVKDNK